MAQDAREIREGIEQTRAELAETVGALGEKADVKSRVRETISGTADQVQRKANEVGEKVRQVTPDAAIATVSSGATKVRQNPPVAFVPIAFACGLLFGWRIGRRS